MNKIRKLKSSKKRDATIKGEPLRPNDRNITRNVDAVLSMVDQMNREVSRETMKLFKSELAKESVAMDASITSQAVIIMNALSRKWEKKFNLFAKKFSKKMTDDQLKYTANDLRTSLEKISGGMTIKTDSISQRTSDIAKASIDQSASLITSIQSDYISDVRAGLMRTITDSNQTFKGLENSVNELLTDQFKKQKNKAKNIVSDQIRKTYQGISDQRMRDAGVTKYEWIHTGGSVQPRVYHRDVLGGEIFDLNDPPIIDPKTGERGHPGDAINCKCIKRPVIIFDDN